MKQIKIIVEKHDDGYASHVEGLNGIIVGQGDTYLGAYLNALSAAWFHITTFGFEAFKR